MKLHSGHPYWSAKDGGFGKIGMAAGALKTDVAVVGGGISGALIASALLDAGIDTVLLDKRQFGLGSTCASTALIQYEVDTPLWKLAGKIGTRQAVRSYRLCLAATKKLKYINNKLGNLCDFESIPSIQLASRASHVNNLRHECRLRKSHGFAVQFLDKAELLKRCNLNFPGALLSTCGAQLDPLKLTYLLLKDSIRRGLRAFSPVCVKRVAQKRSGVVLYLGRHGTVEAKKVVFATGYEAQPYLKRQHCRLFNTYALVSQPAVNLAGWYKRSLIWETARPYVYMRTTKDGRVIMGGEDEPFYNEPQRERRVSAKCRILERRFKKMFPDIPIVPDYAWSGTFAETKDGLAYIGENPDFPNAYFALGYGGNGITYSVIASEIIVDLFLQRKNPDVGIFSFNR